MIKRLFDFVFCCLSKDQQEQVELALENHNPGSVYLAQKNLIKEKHGYRCNECGKFYPFLQLDYQNERIAAQEYSKLAGNVYRYRKAADIFCGQHYYAKNRKTLLKFEADAAHNVRQTDAIPIMGDVYHAILSQDEKYIATETFGGTIEILDVYAKQPVARKQRTSINGSFIFTQDHKLLYYFKEAIRCWDFLENKDRVVWNVPEHWKLSKDGKIRIHVVCNCVIYNSREETFLFACKTAEHTYIVSIKNMEPEKVQQLPEAPTGCELVFSEEENQYTLSEKDSVVIYDSAFRVVESFTPPCIIRIHDGGGMFPVTRHKSARPNRTFLSPNGKWLLLDYFNYLILMGRRDKKIYYCLYSYTGKTALNMGFIDCNHFWYTWGDTTYIQQIEA